MASFVTKVGDTARELKFKVRDGGKLFTAEKWALVQSATIKIVVGVSDEIRVVQKTEVISQLYYRFTNADFVAIPSGVYEWECTLTFADGGAALAPTQGTAKLKVNAKL